MQTKIKMTQNRVEKIKAKNKRTSYYDTATPGLELRVQPSGSKSWYGLIGRKRVFLGKWPETPLYDAQQKCLRLRKEANDGSSPADRETLAESWSKYRENLINLERSQRTIQCYDTSFEKLQRLHDLPLLKVNVERVLQMRDEIAEASGKPSANHALRFLSAVINYARKRGFTGNNPTVAVDKFEENKREKYLEPGQLKGFIEQLESQRSRVADCCLLALFTGVRSKACKTARWKDIDLESGTWRVKDKGRKERIIYLSDYVQAIFERQSPLYECVWGDEIVDCRRTLYRAELAANGLPLNTVFENPEITMHVLRHTFVTYAARAGLPQHIVESMAGHSTGGKSITFNRYVHTFDEWQREGFNLVAQTLLGYAGRALVHESKNNIVVQ